MSTINARARHQARRRLLQALYQRQLVAADSQAILSSQLATMNPKKVDIDFFNAGFQFIIQEIECLDAHVIPYLDRPLSELDAISVSILRIATWELLECLENPYAVVLDEALRLAQTFGATDSYKFINSVLDHVAKTLREAEVLARKKDG